MEWENLMKSSIDMNPLNKAKSYLWFGILPNTFLSISLSLSLKKANVILAHFVTVVHA